LLYKEYSEKHGMEQVEKGLPHVQTLMELAKLPFHYLRQEKEFPCSHLHDFITLKRKVSSKARLELVEGMLRLELYRF